MKKLLFSLSGVWLGLTCAWAANNIKMVTYFPVPYASYSNLGVAGTCDVGLLNTCSLDSGPSLKVSKKGSAHALNSGAITVNSGTLSLDSSATEGKVSGSGLTAGTSMGASGSGSLEFRHNLTVNTMPGTIQSAEATNEAIMKSLTLFGQTFPGCDAEENKISWRNLNINGQDGVFLVCGVAQVKEPSCPDPASGYPNDQRRYWNESLKRCTCANSEFHFFEGACCHPNMPKNTPECWEPYNPVTWTGGYYGKVTVTTQGETPKNCELVYKNGSTGYHNVGIYATDYTTCSSKGAVYGQECQSYQSSCLQNCLVQKTSGPPWGTGTTEWEVTIDRLICTKGGGGLQYRQRWSDSAPYY